MVRKFERGRRVSPEKLGAYLPGVPVTHCGSTQIWIRATLCVAFEYSAMIELVSVLLVYSLSVKYRTSIVSWRAFTHCQGPDDDPLGLLGYFLLSIQKPCCCSPLVDSKQVLALAQPIPHPDLFE